eukprot:483608-Amphidinium_carterae.1
MAPCIMLAREGANNMHAYNTFHRLVFLSWPSTRPFFDWKRRAIATNGQSHRSTKPVAMWH